MSNKLTITRQYISDVIVINGGIDTFKEASKIVDSIIDELIGAINNDVDVKIAGFGKFVVKQTKPRVGRNPVTGEPLTITPRKVCKFQTSDLLKKRINTL